MMCFFFIIIIFRIFVRLVNDSEQSKNVHRQYIRTKFTSQSHRRIFNWYEFYESDIIIINIYNIFMTYFEFKKTIYI